MEWAVKVLEIVGDVLKGVLSPDEGARRIALLDAADKIVDAAEKEKLG